MYFNRFFPFPVCAVLIGRILKMPQTVRWWFGLELMVFLCVFLVLLKDNMKSKPPPAIIPMVSKKTSREMPVKKLEFSNIESGSDSENKSVIDKIFQDLPAKEDPVIHLKISNTPLAPAKKTFKFLGFQPTQRPKSNFAADMEKIQLDHEESCRQINNHFENLFKKPDSENSAKFEEDLKKSKALTEDIKKCMLRKSTLPVILEKAEKKADIDFNPVIQTTGKVEVKEKVEDDGFNPIPDGIKPLGKSSLELNIMQLNKERNEKKLEPHLILPVYKVIGQENALPVGNNMINPFAIGTPAPNPFSNANSQFFVKPPEVAKIVSYQPDPNTVKTNQFTPTNSFFLNKPKPEEFKPTLLNTNFGPANPNSNFPNKPTPLKDNFTNAFAVNSQSQFAPLSNPFAIQNTIPNIAPQTSRMPISQTSTPLINPFGSIPTSNPFVMKSQDFNSNLPNTLVNPNEFNRKPFTTQPIADFTNLSVSQIENYLVLRNSLENFELVIKPQLDEILGIANMIGCSMGNNEIMKISNNLLMIFQKIPQKNLNFARVWLSFHTVESFLHCEDEPSVLMRVAQNVLQVIGLASKHLTEVVECFFNEISAQNEIFTEKAYGSEEALRSLQFADMERLHKGGELQKKVDSELKKAKKLGVLFGYLSFGFGNIGNVKNFLKKLINLEVNRCWIPVVLGLLISSHENLLNSDPQELFIIKNAIRQKISQIHGRCNTLAYQAFITQLETILVK